MLTWNCSTFILCCALRDNYSMKQISLFDFDEPTAAPLHGKVSAKQANVKKSSAADAEQEGAEIVANDEFPEALLPAQQPRPISENKGSEVSEIIELPPEVNAVTKILLQQKKKGKGRKSQKEMAATVHYVNVPADEELFSKRYYNIGIVAEMFCENISLIRFWENEFDILKPKKNGKGNRLFRPEDIKNLKIIHHLLREQKYTLEGAKDFMKRNKKQDETFAVINELKNVKALLGELKASL